MPWSKVITLFMISADFRRSQSEEILTGLGEVLNLEALQQRGGGDLSYSLSGGVLSWSIKVIESIHRHIV
jgi:hypothetical protein